MIRNIKLHKKYTAFLCIILLVFLSIGYAIVLYAKKPKPNIIFITLDALRADHLGCYGYKRNTSPNIDSLAAKGTLFRQAISQATWTTASVSSIITSLYPNHELREAVYSLSPQDDNLIRLLKNKGYATALFTNAYPILNNTFCNIKDDFDMFHISQVKADKMITLVNNWLYGNSEKPFFLWVYLYDTHGPYDAPPSYFSGFLSDNLYPNKNVSITGHEEMQNDYYSFKTLPRYVAENGVTDTSYYIAKYDGGIKFADEQISRLLNALRDKKLENNTLLILFSDHGESLTEHNLYFNHSHFLYEDLIRVPLLIIFPDKLPKKVVNQQVQLIDIFPTIMDILGIKNNKNIEGKSLLPLIKGSPSQLDAYAFSETLYYPSPSCIRTEDWKLIYNRKKENYELYNLKEDPGELYNLIKEREEIANSLKSKLDNWSKTAGTNSLSSKDYLPSEESEKLKSLGYLQ